MNYQKIYDSLVERAKLRTTTDYTESHHIIPRCMGGSDDSSNLVNLLPEEHFLAHLLLVKIHRGSVHHPKLVYAAKMMTLNTRNHQRSTSRNKFYGWLREEFCQVLKNRSHSAETRAKLSKSNTGKKHSDETKEKIAKLKKELAENPSEAQLAAYARAKGRPNPKISAQMVGKPGNKAGKKLSDEARKRISDSHKGLKYPNKKPMSEETKAKISKTNKEKHLAKLKADNGGVLPPPKEKKHEWSEESKMNFKKPKARMCCVGCKKDVPVHVFGRWHTQCGIIDA